jgi:hypothetical protein
MSKLFWSYAVTVPGLLTLLVLTIDVSAEYINKNIEPKYFIYKYLFFY